jgi:phosphoglycerate dehydrogenase-like enzyme
MSTTAADRVHVHFETRPNKPRVFCITQALIDDAKARNKISAPTSLGEEWRDLSLLAPAVGIVAGIDLIADPKFPRGNLPKIAPNLRWIQATGAGIEPALPLDWLPPQVVLLNNSGVHVDKVRESALMMLLMLNGRVPEIISNQRKARWDQIFTPQIRGRTVLVIGVGDMGGGVAQAGRQLGLRVLGVRRSGAPHPDVERMFGPGEIDAALPQADFVVVATPLTHETTALMDRRRFALMKPGAGFINIGRGGSVDHAALADCLRTRAISGAVIDVYEQEPLPASSPLWGLDNLIMMPHVTSDDADEYLPKTFDMVFENVRRFAAGQPLLNVIDSKRGY